MKILSKITLLSIVIPFFVCSCTSRKESELKECAELDNMLRSEYDVSATIICYSLVAEKYEDESICELIPDEITTFGDNTFNKNFFDKAWCYAGVAYAKEDISLCARIEIANAPHDPVEECYYKLCKDACSMYFTGDSVRNPELCEALKQLDNIDCE
jgi:hypothetical protein